MHSCWLDALLLAGWLAGWLDGRGSAAAAGMAAIDPGVHDA